MISLAALVLAQAANADAIRYASVTDIVFVSGERLQRNDAETSTATRTTTPIADIPQAITVIDESLIDDAAMRSLADVLRFTPGATMGQGEGHRDAPTLRGSSSTADFFVDGVRDDVQYFRDLYNAERIEILKGPNAMIFGRGGAGGVINRVTKRAEGERMRDITISGGTFGEGRATIDLGGATSERSALRVNAFYENSDSYRDYAGVERFGVNPTAAFSPSNRTDILVSFERFSDDRTVDRGVPSQNGLPYAGDRSAFFGDPRASYMTADVNLATLAVEHRITSSLTLKNRTLFADYDKFYQNRFARTSVAANGSVGLQAYASGADRRNFFNQTDVVFDGVIAGMGHTLLVGMEFGNQTTDNTRTATSNAGSVTIAAPTLFGAPLALAPQTDNRVEVGLAAFYAQDQIEVTEYLQLIGGVRFDSFDLKYVDQLSPTILRRKDEVASPRGGVVLKPIRDVSIYGGYSRSFLPQSGDQFASLTATLAALEPERFENLEVGVKWRLVDRIDLAVAAYQLDRDNTRAIDPNTSASVLTGAQRSKGIELGLSGHITPRLYAIAAAAFQDSKITRDTTAAPAGRETALTPQTSFSIWARYDFSDRISVAAGLAHASDQFASISNAVVLPSYTRVDIAAFVKLSERFKAQVNVDNLLDDLYFPTAHNDNNITPGAPRTFRASISASL